jgi:hypothetical protein
MNSVKIYNMLKISQQMFISHSSQYSVQAWKSNFKTKRQAIDFISVTKLMHKFLFIHIILQSATCFEQYYAHPQEVTLYTCSIWYCHSLWAFVVFVRYTGLARSDCSLFSLNLCTATAHRECDTICCMYTMWPPKDEHSTVLVILYKKRNLCINLVTDTKSILWCTVRKTLR